MNILICAVNYYQSEVTKEFIKSVKSKINHATCKLTVIDNSESEGEFKIFEKEILNQFSHDVELFWSGGNLGYFGAVEKYIKEEVTEYPDLLIISNNDVEIITNDFFEHLTKINVKNIGAIGPSIVSANGMQQNPLLLNRPNKFGYLIKKLVFSNYKLAKFVLNNKSSKKVIPNAILPKHSVYAIHGAFMILTRELLRRADVFSNIPFLYGEEISVAESCRVVGLKCKLDDKLKIYHKEHVSTGNELSLNKYLFMKDGVNYTYKKLFGDLS